jgi:DNA-directed RNA polymerase subunit RPC12/RpoP
MGRLNYKSEKSAAYWVRLWIPYDDGLGGCYVGYECATCGKRVGKMLNYCPGCGSKMDMTCEKPEERPT